MTISSKLVTAIIIFTLNLSSTLANASDYTIKQIDTNTLSYQGKIVEGSALDLGTKLNPEIRQLRITSRGGNVREAMLIGRLLSEKGIAVIVDQYCIAACANYVFLGAKAKNLTAGCLLGFQDLLPLRDFTELKRRFDQQEINSQNFETNNGKTNSAEYLQILEWEYLLSLKLESNTLTKIYNKMQEGINTNNDISKQMRTASTTASSHYIEDIGVPNEIDRKLQIAKSRRSFSMKTEKNGTDTVYFPQSEFLIALGIKGINAYPYPSDEVALNALFHKDLDNIKTIAYFNQNTNSAPGSH